MRHGIFIQSFLLMFLCTLVAQAQVKDYVGVVEEGEGTYHCFLVKMDPKAGTMVDTLWVLWDNFDGVPPLPPKRVLELDSLFYKLKPAVIKLHLQKASHDSTVFRSDRLDRSDGAWEEFSFRGKRSNGRLQGVMRLVWCPGEKIGVYPSNAKMTFRKVR